MSDYLVVISIITALNDVKYVIINSPVYTICWLLLLLVKVKVK